MRGSTTSYIESDNRHSSWRTVVLVGAHKSVLHTSSILARKLEAGISGIEYITISFLERWVPSISPKRLID